MSLEKLKDYSGLIIWSVTMIFFIGITYSQVLTNAKRIDSLEGLNSKYTHLKSEQDMINKRFDYQEESQQALLKAIESLGSTLNGIEKELTNNIKETEKNNLKLEMIKESLDELKDDKK